MKTISVAVDDELYLQFQHALGSIAAGMGVERVSSSVVLRDLISNLLKDPRPPFERGWMEGYKAAYAAVMRTMQEALHRLENDPTAVNGLGVGMSSPMEDRSIGG